MIYQQLVPIDKIDKYVFTDFQITLLFTCNVPSGIVVLMVII